MSEDDGPSLEELLERWKAAERQRDGHLPGSPERQRAEDIVDNARQAYRRRLAQLEPSLDGDDDGSPAGGSQ
jgi:hypothetical protein